MSDQEPKDVRQILDDLGDFEIIAHASGHKSSEGDGRTAAEIRAELGLEGREDGTR